MKQTIEVDIKDGYEIEDTMYRTNTVVIYLKKNNVKTFAFFVDEYLYDNGSTCEKISNWIGETSLDHMKSCLKTNQFDMVPWEIKIGLFKFICEQHKMDSNDIVGFIVHYKASKCAEFGSAYIGYSISKICSYEFLSDVLQTK